MLVISWDICLTPLVCIKGAAEAKPPVTGRDSPWDYLTGTTESGNHEKKRSILTSVQIVV